MYVEVFLLLQPPQLYHALDLSLRNILSSIRLTFEFDVKCNTLVMCGPQMLKLKLGIC